MRKSQKRKEHSLIEDYKNLFADSNEAPWLKNYEWEKNGDEFVQFSLFKDYPPAMTSDRTSYRNRKDQDA